MFIEQSFLLVTQLPQNSAALSQIYQTPWYIKTCLLPKSHKTFITFPKPSILHIKLKLSLKLFIAIYLRKKLILTVRKCCTFFTVRLSLFQMENTAHDWLMAVTALKAVWMICLLESFHCILRNHTIPPHN